MKMEPWLLLGMVAALSFGINIILFKIGFRSGINPYMAQLIFTAGVFIVSLAAFFFFKGKFDAPLGGSIIMLFTGMVWAIGGVAVAVAMSMNADASKLAVVLSSNVIISVILGLLVLKEAATSAELIRIVIGMVLVVSGVLTLSLR